MESVRFNFMRRYSIGKSATQQLSIILISFDVGDPREAALGSRLAIADACDLLVECAEVVR